MADNTLFCPTWIKYAGSRDIISTVWALEDSKEG